MTRTRSMMRWASLYAGTVLALLGMIALAMAASATARSGLIVLYVAGVSLLVVSTPLLAFFFVKHAAKPLAVALVGVLVVGSLWLAFVPDGPPSRTVVHQVAAMALGVLFAWRIGSALLRARRRRSIDRARPGKPDE